MRQRLRALAASVLRPPLLTAAYMLGLAYLAGRRAEGDSRVFGVEAAQVTNAIASHFGHHIKRASAHVTALAAFYGLALGLAAELMVRARARARGEPPPPALALRALAVSVALHLAMLVVAIAERPAMFDDVLYARGGPARLLQVLATDVLGVRGAVTLFVTIAAAYTLGAPLPARDLARRALDSVRAALSALRRPVPAALSAAVVLAAAAPSVATSPRGNKNPDRPNILILAADSLRPDRINGRTAPHLAALASRSTVFERAYVSLPRTFPSWVTLLTGRYPHTHGIRNMFPSRTARARDFDALPQRLGKNGYATAVVSDFAGDVFPRIELGFERVDAPTFHLGELIKQRALEAELPLMPLIDSRLGRALSPSMVGLSKAPDARGVARRTLAAIDHAHDRPFFVLTFFSTAHFPYAAPSPGYGRFTSASYRGRFKYQKANVLGREAPPDDDDITHIRGLYDGAVSVVDEASEAVLRGLASRGLDRSTVVLVMADHGETLFENQRGHGHGDHLFGEEALRVPLIVHDGRKPEGRSVGGIARDVDVAPTIYALTGTAPPDDLTGTSLVPQLGGAPLTTDVAFAETGLWFTEEVPGVPPELRLPYPDLSRMGEVLQNEHDDVVLQDAFLPLTNLAKHRAIITPKHKLVIAPTRMGLRTMLFDTERDPACTDDIAQREPDLRDKLRERLLAWVLEDDAIELRGAHLVARPRKTGKGDGAFRLDEP